MLAQVLLVRDLVFTALPSSWRFCSLSQTKGKCGLSQGHLLSPSFSPQMVETAGSRAVPPTSGCFTPPPSRGGNQELGSPPSQSGSFRVWGHPVAVLVGTHELPEGESSREGWAPRAPASAVTGFCSYLILHVGLLTSVSRLFCTCFSGPCLSGHCLCPVG